MIDIHAHVLPGLDDGPRTVEEALTMLRIAQQEGTATIIATPHFDGSDSTVLSLAASVLRVVQQRASQCGLGVKIASGFEVALSPALSNGDINVEDLVLNNSRYILVEAPVAFWPAYVEECLFWLQTQGLRPILAHVERYKAVQTNLDRAVQLHQRGVLLQVNAGSVTGGEGRQEQRCAKMLLRRNLAHFIASDCHSAKQRRPGLRNAAAKARRIVGGEAAGRLTMQNPQAVSLDHELPAPAEITHPMRFTLRRQLP